MRAWPGPVLTIAGLATAVGALVAARQAFDGALPGDLRPLIGAIGVAGALMMVVGLAYELVRQVRRRRTLAQDRYRGPAIVLLLALAFVLGTIVQLPFTPDALALESSQGQLTLAGSVVLVTSLQAALLLVSWLFVLRPRAIAFATPLLGRGHLHALAAGLGWGLLAWVAATAATLLMVVLLDRVGLLPPPGPAEQAIAQLEPWVVVPAVVLLAPIAEEVFFRGVAFNAWLRERGRSFAYIGSAALFAASHVSLVQLLPIFLLGLGLAWIYRRTGSLLAPVAMHATVNGISVTLALLIRYEVIPVPV